MDIAIYIVLNVVVFLLLCIGVQLRQIKKILKGNSSLLDTGQSDG